eukprot:TRINITY_DN55566_c0_g1_i1.p1 TRINITY_DN55566_c0_g1~~TRINITY_DN55566_c0_g1_i1.p1  ORF type:complete len:537 (-),score=71.02 TRINITY_DN55566_c0_g1_i1:34-1644(-)
MGGQRCFRHAGQIFYGNVLEREDGSIVRHGQGLQIMTADTVKGGGTVTFSVSMPTVEFADLSATATNSFKTSLAKVLATEVSTVGVEVSIDPMDVSLPAAGGPCAVRVAVRAPLGVSSSAIQSTLSSSTSLPAAVVACVSAALPEPPPEPLATDAVSVGDFANPDPGIIWGQYKGAWKADSMNGMGTYMWSDGSCYEGNFVNGNMNGHGRLRWPEGSVYDGDWACGEMCGQGEFFNAFTKVKRNGVFYRNCWQRHDQTWLDVTKEREKHRRATLHIGASEPHTEAEMIVIRCTPEDLAGWLDSVRQEPPYLVPLILADSTCPRGPERQSPSPLWCLEAGDHGCTPETAVHMGFAAEEKQQKREHQNIFRKAIREALLTFRTFALVFGDRRDTSCPPPASHSVAGFLDPLSLPPDIFDLRHFHASGCVEAFLPHEKVSGSVTRALLPQLPGISVDTPSSTEKRKESKEVADSKVTPSASSTRKDAPLPTAYLLNFALVSLCTINAGMCDAEVRAHLREFFAEHVPLHRVAAVVVGAG